MSAQRKLIRNFIASVLRNKRVISTNNIGVNRAKPVWTENLPAINIKVEDDEVAVVGESPREFEHGLDVVIEIFNKGRTESGLSDSLDDTGEKVEEALFADEFLGGLVESQEITSFSLDIKEDGTEMQGALRLTIRATYRQFRPKDTFNQSVDDLKTIDAKYQLSEDEDVEKAEDLITLPTE